MVLILESFFEELKDKYPSPEVCQEAMVGVWAFAERHPEILYEPYARAVLFKVGAVHVRAYYRKNRVTTIAEPDALPAPNQVDSRAWREYTESLSENDWLILQLKGQGLTLPKIAGILEVTVYFIRKRLDFLAAKATRYIG